MLSSVSLYRKYIQVKWHLKLITIFMPSFFRHSSFDSHYHLEVHLGICIVQVFAFCDPAYCNAGWLQGWQMLQGCTAGWRQGNDAAYPAAEDEAQETHDTCALEWWGSSMRRCWNRNEIYWESLKKSEILQLCWRKFLWFMFHYHNRNQISKYESWQARQNS